MKTQILSPTGLVPLENTVLVEKLDGLRARGGKPMSASRIAILDRISRNILKSPQLRQNPQHVALAYWMRRAAVTRLVEKWLPVLTLPDAVLVPRGLAVHFPPTNVDTIFVYSWALSLLAGNSNVVRLPSEPDTVTLALAQLIVGVLDEAGEGDAHLFLCFAHDGPVLADLSAAADVRMIWGGDAKVQAVSAYPTRPDGLTVGFPDRRSFAVFSTDTYLATENGARDALAQRFYNDLFWFDQMACGSPRMLLWVGADDATARAATQDFCGRLAAAVKARGYAVDPATRIAKMITAFGLLADGAAQRLYHFANALDILEADGTQDLLSVRQGGGFLLTSRVGSVSDVAGFADPALQTITQFGFDPDALYQLADAIGLKGGYRIVPVGEALNFGEVWDGIPLLSHLTRSIVIRLDR